MKEICETDLNRTGKQTFDPGLELTRLRVDPRADIEEPAVFCKIVNPDGSESPVMTGGNFSLVIGKAKSRKTFFLTALVPAIINNTYSLGRIIGSLPEDQKNILYFDTEQGNYHLHKTIKRICEIAGREPGNLFAYGLRPLTPKQRLQVIQHGINSFDSPGLVVIDGIRDLCTIGINDEAEATALTSQFLKWTSEKNIHLLLVLHQNKNDLNARGHLGTEATNKAETVFSIAKDPKAGNLSIVNCEYSRDIEFEPFAFIIEKGLPVGADMPEADRQEKRTAYPDQVPNDTHFEILSKIFKDAEMPGYGQLWRAVKVLFAEKGIRFGDNKAKDFITHYTNEKWICKNGSGYEYKRAVF